MRSTTCATPFPLWADEWRLMGNEPGPHTTLACSALAMHSTPDRLYPGGSPEPDQQEHTHPPPSPPHPSIHIITKSGVCACARALQDRPSHPESVHALFNRGGGSAHVQLHMGSASPSSPLPAPALCLWIGAYI